MPRSILPAVILCLLLSHVVSTPTDTSNTSTFTSASGPRSLAHCECRCCKHVWHFRTSCSSNVTVVPLPPPRTCDTRVSSHDAFVCGPLLCLRHFPSQCTPPAFMTHACVSDRGPLRDWLPLVFAFCALFALAYGAARQAATGPRRDARRDGVEEAMAYKREPVPQSGEGVIHPLLAQGGQVLYDDGASVQVVDVGPRSPLGKMTAPPLQLRGSLLQSYSLPYAKSVNPMRTVLPATARGDVADPRGMSPSPVPEVRDERLPARDERVT